MPANSSKTFVALILLASSALSGCATSLGTKLSTPFGYINDHPNPADTSKYDAVKTWAYGVSDGYSSRGTMNRYSLYWGAAIAAGGAGALGGLAATGSSGHASVIIPLATAFLGTLFGYYQNEELAQVYFSASDSINTLINQSQKRLSLRSSDQNNQDRSNNSVLGELRAKLLNDLNSATAEQTEQIKSKNGIPQDANSLKNPGQTTVSPDTIAALGKAVDLANAKIAEAKRKIDLANKRKQNLELLLNNSSPETYEAGCLNEDVNNVIHRVHTHLALLDPQHVSEDLKNVKASTGNTNNSSDTNPSKQVTLTPNTFDLSDLDPIKIVSACDIGL